MPTLPKGYSLADPSITIDGQSLYGGADISQAFDATGAHYVACDARGPDGVFKFRVFKKAVALGATAPVDGALRPAGGDTFVLVQDERVSRAPLRSLSYLPAVR